MTTEPGWGDEAWPAEPVRRRWFRWYYLASGFFLLQVIGGFTVVDRMAYGEWAGKSGDKLTQLLNLVQIGLDLALFGRGYLKARRLSTGAWLALGLALFLLSSVLWSVDPPTTLRRGVLYVLFILGAIGISENLSGDEFMDLLREVCFLSAVLSLVLLVAVPHDALTPQIGGLRGIFPHKNILGMVMVAGVLASLHGLRIGGGRRLACVVMIVVFFVAIVLSRSGTSLMTAMTFCGVDLILTLLRRGGAGRAFGLLLVAVALPVLLVVIVSPDLILNLLGKDPTLTGRTLLWEYVEHYIGERPLLGWGLMAFWSPSNPLAEAISNALGWVIPEAHNGVLELLLEVGVVGTLLFLVVMVRNVVLALRCLGTQAGEFGASSLLCHVGIVMVGVTEQVMVDFSEVYVGVFFITGLICERSLREMREADFALIGHEPMLGHGAV